MKAKEAKRLKRAGPHGIVRPHIGEKEHARAERSEMVTVNGFPLLAQKPRVRADGK